MSYVIIFLCIGATLHFVYESIVAPTLRIEQRFRLFAIRDRLRSLKARLGDELDPRVFHELQDSINIQINVVELFSLVSLMQARARLRENKDLGKKVKARLDLIEACTVPEVKEIADECLQVAMCTSLINSAGWAFYIVPLIYCRKAMTWLSTRLKAIVLMREGELPRVLRVRRT